MKVSKSGFAFSMTFHWHRMMDTNQDFNISFETTFFIGWIGPVTEWHSMDLEHSQTCFPGKRSGIPRSWRIFSTIPYDRCCLSLWITFLAFPMYCTLPEGSEMA